MKEKGMPKNASAKAKAMDKKMDKAKRVKEGSKADIKMDKSIAKKFPPKPMRGVKKGPREMY